MSMENTPMAMGVLAVVAVVALSAVSRSTRRQQLHKERMAALEKGVPLPEDLLVDPEAGAEPRSPARNAALQGTVWTGLGLGMMAANWFVEPSAFGSDMRQFLAFLEVWAYPATFVGVGLLVFAFFAREKK